MGGTGRPALPIGRGGRPSDQSPTATIFPVFCICSSPGSWCRRGRYLSAAVGVQGTRQATATIFPAFVFVRLHGGLSRRVLLIGCGGGQLTRQVTATTFPRFCILPLSWGLVAASAADRLRGRQGGQASHRHHLPQALYSSVPIGGVPSRLSLFDLGVWAGGQATAANLPVLCIRSAAAARPTLALFRDSALVTAAVSSRPRPSPRRPLPLLLLLGAPRSPTRPDARCLFRRHPAGQPPAASGGRRRYGRYPTPVCYRRRRYPASAVVRGGPVSPSTGSAATLLAFPPAPDTAADLSAVADYLISRADVDGARLGVTGISLGGMTAWYAAAADTR